MKRLILLTAIAVSAFVQTIAQTLPSYVPSAGLIGYWGFNGNANDYSPKGNNGVINGAVLVPDRFGNANNAYQFGPGQTISIPDSTYLDGMTTGLSFSFWVKVQNSGLLNILISKFTGCTINGDDAYGVYIQPNGILQMQYINAGGVSYNQFGTNVIADNQWHNIAIVWNNPQTTIYVDGVADLTASTTSYPGPITVTNPPLIFGHGATSCPTTYAYGESLDDICMYNRALTQNEVSTLYLGCTSAPTVTIAALGKTTFCAGGDVLLKCSTTSVVSYQWKKNNVNINGATSDRYTANASGTYKCVVTNSCGTATSNGIALTSIANAAMTLTASGSTAFCAGDSLTINTNKPAGYTLQWYRNNISLLSDTANSYVAKQPGTYKVVSKNTATGCSRISTSNVVATVNCRIANPNLRTGSIEDKSELMSPINLYPNPNAGSFTFEYAGLNEDENETAVIQLYNSTGQKVYEFTIDVQNGRVSKELNLDGSVENGIYMLNMEINGKAYKSKVMIN